MMARPPLKRVYRTRFFGRSLVGRSLPHDAKFSKPDYSVKRDKPAFAYEILISASVPSNGTPMRYCASSHTVVTTGFGTAKPSPNSVIKGRMMNTQARQFVVEIRKKRKVIKKGENRVYGQSKREALKAKART
ncbi:hypothetical protein FZ934_19275 (plasmid) [Rhizobium grahamii]|uniref:Uncharacterized protein n=1 Tax=Rhizobium grahamii TaxID=1120045 RepID=A0A5Q0CB08_9HYPH|nr:MULTISPECIES: hypothetical protein [Rhizobium]QFY62535.1 hypothetical protein FZ934_19275 [Rhizobium grahamii]QRM52723.1 hypothetical protein F3Y33_26385 [Rhizobium sp. BG6]